jgi:hypothetical protein
MFWQDLRRPSTYLMLAIVVALSLKAHRVFFHRDPDPWLLHPRYFARWTAPPSPLLPARPAPYIRRPERTRFTYTADLILPRNFVRTREQAEL